MEKLKFEVVHDAPMVVGECPLWHPVESALYWVDINSKTVNRVHPASGKYTEWKMDSEPSALARDAAGDGLVVATRAGFVHLNTTDGSTTPIVAAPYDQSVIRFNDGRVDPQGRFWVGTLYEPRTEAVAEMYVLEKGQLRKAWSGGMTVSNGLAFSADGSQMYHADTTTHRIDRYDFDGATGTVANVQRFQQFSTDKSAEGYRGRPDGAAVDSEGCYWSAMIEGGRVVRYAPDGQVLQEIAVPFRCPTMMAFGGPDLKTLYITSLSHGRSEAEKQDYPLTGKVVSVRVDVAGRPEPAYMP